MLRCGKKSQPCRKRRATRKGKLGSHADWKDRGTAEGDPAFEDRKRRTLFEAESFEKSNCDCSSVTTRGGSAENSGVSSGVDLILEAAREEVEPLGVAAAHLRCNRRRDTSNIMLNFSIRFTRLSGMDDEEGMTILLGDGREQLNDVTVPVAS